jgi:hypothetical protein
MVMAELEQIISGAENRTTALQSVADLLKRIGEYR